MILSGQAHVAGPGQGRVVDPRGRDDAGAGQWGRRPWRRLRVDGVLGDQRRSLDGPALHRGFEESFFVLDGMFTFTVGEQAIEASTGMYVLVPRGTAHTISAAAGGGRFLTLMVPGGLEEMFFELGRLSPNAIRDPAARAAISARYDSIPV